MNVLGLPQVTSTDKLDGQLQASSPNMTFLVLKVGAVERLGDFQPHLPGEVAGLRGPGKC